MSPQPARRTRPAVSAATGAIATPRHLPPPSRTAKPNATSGAWLLVPLRLFLGVTFVYAGLQKLADRWFFKASAPSSLQSQLHGAIRTSPIGGLLGGASHHAVLLGLLIAFGELAIGVGTLLGLWTRVAASTGAVLSFGFLLTVSWHSRPYYYGADVVFLFAWTPMIIGGAGPLSLDTLLAGRARADLGLPPSPTVTVGFDAVQRYCGYYEGGRCQAQRGRRCEPAGCPVLAPAEPASTRAELDRRTVLARATAAGWIGAGALLTGGVVAALGRIVTPRSRSTPTAALGGATATTAPSDQGEATAGAAGPTAAPATGQVTGPTSTPGAAPPTAGVSGTPIGAASAVPVGGAASFTDPSTGDPAFAVRPARGRFVAFDATCTHQGCPVELAGSEFQCPCHGAAFDVATGAVLRGPARRPLVAIPIRVGPDGQLYVD